MILKLDSLLKDSLARAGIKQQVDSALVLDKFMDVLREIFASEYTGERADEILKDLNPMCLKNKILTVACLNNSLSQELKLREKTILYKLNSVLGKEFVEKIIFIL
ncbi:MAG: DciA family protein [bacterium]